MLIRSGTWLRLVLGTVLLMALPYLAVSQETATPDRATIVIRVPADATVLIADDPTTQTGTERTFITPVLNKAKKRFSYAVKATWIENGKAKTVSRVVQFTAGERVVVDLTRAPEAPKVTPKPPEVKKDTPKPPVVKKDVPKPPEVKKDTPKPPEVKKDTPKPPEVKKDTPKPPVVKKDMPKPPVVKKDTPKPPVVKKDPAPPIVIKKDTPKPPVEVKKKPKDEDKDKDKKKDRKERKKDRKKDKDKDKDANREKPDDRAGRVEKIKLPTPVKD